MKIYVISSDSFLAQEMITNFPSNDYSIEIHENGLEVLSDIRDDIPDAIVIDNDCDGINPLVLNKILNRDSRFEKTSFHYVISKPIKNDDEFLKNNNIVNLLIKPVDFKNLKASLK
mgnify:FL=1|tara:strand:- start:839 stop:1186 length:348 start_codon:yes stop_codon:yes gene_type:complete